jgi:hypothetical protein
LLILTNCFDWWDFFVLTKFELQVHKIIKYSF